MFEVMSTIKKIKVDGQAIRRVCDACGLALSHIEYDDKKYTENAVVILNFYNKCDDEKLTDLVARLSAEDDVRTMVSSHYLIEDRREVTLLSIILDGIFYTEKEN